MNNFNKFNSINFLNPFLFTLIIFKFYILTVPFASTDLIGLSERYLFQINSINTLTGGRDLLPYLPFVEIIYFYVGKLTELLKINYVFGLKFISVLFEIFLAFLIIKFFQKNKNVKLDINLLLIFILLNPLSLFISSFLGFFDTLWIFFLLLSIYYFEFEEDKKKEILIPFLLTISACIKPISLFFVFYFFYKSNFKKLFVLIFVFSTILFHLPFLISNFDNPNVFYLKFEKIITKFIFGHQVGQFGFSEVEKLLIKSSESNPILFFITKIFKIFELLIIFYIYYVCVNSKKIKSYEFIYLVFLSILFLNDNLHENYLYYILPFAILINFKKTFYFSLLILCLIFENSTRGTIQLPLYNFPNYFNFIEPINFDNLRSEDQNFSIILIRILIYYYSLILICEKKILKKINFNYFQIKTFNHFFKNTINLKNESFLIEKFKSIKIYIVPIFFVFLYLSQINDFNIIYNKEKKFKESLKLPEIITKMNSHGYKIKFSSNFSIDRNKNYEIIYLTGYFSSLKINNKQVHSGYNIVHKKFHNWKISEKLYQEKISINEFLKAGNNKIEITSNLPHSMENFGLLFLIFEDNKIVSLTEDLKWKVKINGKIKNYSFIDLKKNNYFEKNKMFLNDSLNLKTKVLKVYQEKEKKGLDPRNFLIIIFICISIISYFTLLVIKIKESKH